MPENITPTSLRQTGLITRFCAWAISGLFYGGIILGLLTLFIGRILPFAEELIAAHPLLMILLLPWLISIICFFFYFTADACLAALCGDGIGKLALGLRTVKNDGSSLSFYEHFKRNMLILALCFAGGLPGLNTLAHLISYVLYRMNEERTIWDKWMDTTVISRSSSTARTVICMLLGMLAVCAIEVGSIYYIVSTPRLSNAVSAITDTIEEKRANATLPRRIDDHLVLYHIDITPSRRTYHYRQEGKLGEDLTKDLARRERLKNRMTASIARKLCPIRLNPSSEDDDHDVAFDYYNDTTTLLFEILIDTDTCLKIPTH